jgi:hypothetical protein
MAVEIVLITPNPWLLQQLNLTLTDQGFRIKLAVNKRPHNIFSQDQHSCRYLQVQIIENLGVSLASSIDGTLQPAHAGRHYGCKLCDHASYTIQFMQPLYPHAEEKTDSIHFITCFHL